jgi:DNA-3-methyladenine glycosylase
MVKVPQSFYFNPDVLDVARSLLGKILATQINGVHTAGRIVETEAYAGVTDKASHAYGGRNTARTSVMYAPGGTAYVYLCYGIHALFNVVSNEEGVPHATLIRAVEPVSGIDEILKRTGKRNGDPTITRGPGNVSKALGIIPRHTGTSLAGNLIYLLDDGYTPPVDLIGTSPRIGVDYAGEDALLPYRYFIMGNRFVSKSKFRTPDKPSSSY